MNKKMDFTKLVAAGNDFVLMDNRSARMNGSRLASLAKRICDRKYGAGADGLLVVEKSRKADFRMRIFNADGSEAEMCGNGSRCFALYCVKLQGKSVAALKIETLAGIIAAHVNKDQVRVNLTAPKGLRLDVPVRVSDRLLHVNYIDTGVPHGIIFVKGLASMEIVDLGRAIRYHKSFAPRGTNVDFVEVTGQNSISIRTYERGVEDETLACGTGSVASALITGLKLQQLKYSRVTNAVQQKFKVLTRGGEVLKIYFTVQGDKFSDVWLEGKAGIVYKGVWHV
ncbi:MAG TPA: diaminopimelate epimerase [Candidatus Omnitrophota bacterium]|nr:diaminopimelate epimerase [Candidatus Omnitrophota bacterium]